MSINSIFEVKRESQQPLVAVTLCFVGGIVAAFYFSFDYLWLIVGVVASIALHLLLRWRWVLYLSVILGGAIAAILSQEGREELPDRGLYALEIISSRDVMVEAVRSDEGEWRGVMQPLIYGCDSTLRFNVGDRVVAHGKVTHFSKMRGYIYISQSGVIDQTKQATLSTRLNEAMCRGVDRWSLSAESTALVKAMLLGHRSDIDESLLRGYQRSGAAHILAVSGLHVGIVALIFSYLLRPISLIYRGHILRSILLILLIWFYAYVVGMSGSVVRASIMYTALVAAPLLTSEYNSLNLLSFCVLAIALHDPTSIFDIGLQLSVVAVASIVLWALPIWSLRGGAFRGWWFDMTLLPLLIGGSCTVATLPIISHTFGYVSPFGVLLNPLLLVTAYTILTLSIVWLIVTAILGSFALFVPLFAPLFNFVSYPFRHLIEACVVIQNGAAEWASSAWRDAIDLRISGLSVILIYFGYLLLTILLTNYISSKAHGHRR